MASVDIGPWLAEASHRLAKLRKSASAKRVKASDRRLLPHPVPAHPARSGLALVAIVKDEAPFIEEWIDVHMKFGVRHFYIYDNGSTDETRALLHQERFRATVTVVPWASFHKFPQVLAHNHALANFGGMYRWMGFIDVDEFIFPTRAPSLNDALGTYDDLPLLALPWHMFGFSGHDKRPTGPVTENFTQRAPFPPSIEHRSLLNWKLLVDPTRIDFMKTHVAGVIDEGPCLINEDRQRFTSEERRNPRFAVSRHLQLNHYYTRSKQDFDAKLAKGAVSNVARKNNGNRRREKAELIERETITDTALLDRLLSMNTQLHAA